MAKIPFLAFSHYHGNYFVKFLAHVLSWVKTYHHAKFQRNPLTGLAGIMVYIYLFVTVRILVAVRVARFL